MALPEYELLSQIRRPAESAAPANLPCVEEEQASAEVAALYEHFRSRFGRPDVPGLLKCFATHPPLLQHMMDLAETMLFADGHLTRRQKEMIATFVSSLNECTYCADSHGYFLLMQGGSLDTLCALQQNDIESASLTGEEQALLSFAQKINGSSHEIGRVDVERVCEAGWSEAQITEVVHLVALFATFNRVANAFGLQSQGMLQLYKTGERNEP